MKIIFTLLIFAVALISTGIAIADTGGHCNFSHSSAYADEPYMICEMPTNAEDCAAVGNAEGNADAVYGDGACSAENIVGTCDTGESKMIYYNGDASGLEIGCSFQSGEWVTAE